MPRKGLLILVEGPSDADFFDTLIKPILLNKYEFVKVIQYRQWTKGKTEDCIRNIQSAGWDYVFIADKNDAPCITKRKQDLKDTYNCLDSDEIVVVEAEIESWYLAGIGEELANELGIEIPPSTEGITKEKFKERTGHSLSEIDFRQMILESFSVDAA